MCLVNGAYGGNGFTNGGTEQQRNTERHEPALRAGRAYLPFPSVPPFLRCSVWKTVPPSTPFPRTASDLGDDCIHHLLRCRRSTEIGRANVSAGDDALDGAEDAIVECAVAEVFEHQRRRPRRADRVRDPL